MNETPESIHRNERVAYWDDVARQMDTSKSWGDYYRWRLTKVYQFLVAVGQRVLEVGCGQGDLLAALEPAVGIGVDFSQEMIQRAKQRYPHLSFIQADAHTLELDQKFDVIIISDLINDLWDVQRALTQIAQMTTPRSRLIMNFYSHLWELPLSLAGRIGLSRPRLAQNWLTVEDVVNLLDLADLEVIRTWTEFLWPFHTPFLHSLFNRFLVRFWPLNVLALTNFLIARPQLMYKSADEEPTVSVIIPARNEAGNIPEIFARTPRIGREIELVFVEGHSNDDTYEVIERNIADHPEWRCQLLRQTGIGKGDAVRSGFDRAKGEVLMILDADLAVPPEYLPRFYDALRRGKGEFVNGVRLVYPMGTQAMRFFNLLGNKFFSVVFSWLLGQPMKDTLCGTKVLWKADYDLIAANRTYFGDFDPFGDYDLLFGAVKLGLKTVDLPIRYRERTYGTTNIKRWKHGWLLLQMVIYAAWRIKFV
jgi:SAM-dependent methyltransferase